MRVVLIIFILSSILLNAADYEVKINGKLNNKARALIDGDFRTSFNHSQKGPVSITVDLKKEQQIKGFVHIPFLNNVKGRIKSLSVDISQDNKEWQKVYSGELSYPKNISMWPNKKDKINRIILDSPVLAKYYHINIQSTIEDLPVRISEFVPVFSDSEPFKGKTLADLKGLRYAPSIHLSYKVPHASVYYNEIEVTKSAPGSFFMGIGFNQGYFGIQEPAQGKKHFIFSIWDSNDHDKNAQTEDKRVKVIHHDKGTRFQRFGHEGSGGQSFYDYDWQIGQKIRLALKIEDKGERRHYSSYIYITEKKKWVHMLTFSSIAPQKHLSRFHSFVEDFRRNYESFTWHRGMKVHQVWAKGLDGKWHYGQQSRFTRDGNPHTNITAYEEDGAFYFGTGGTVDQEVAPGTTIKRASAKTPPTDLHFE